MRAASFSGVSRGLSKLLSMLIGLVVVIVAGIALINSFYQYVYLISVRPAVMIEYVDLIEAGDNDILILNLKNTGNIPVDVQHVMVDGVGDVDCNVAGNGSPGTTFSIVCFGNILGGYGGSISGMLRKAISVMFMTFIAVSILAATFVTMYLYLAQQGLSATEAQRIYAEAAQEKLQVILDRRTGEILMNNTGGIGVVVKYLVCLKSTNKMASIYNLGQIPIPAGGGFQLPIPGNFSCNYPSEGLYVMTERGNLFMAVPGGFSFELEASPANITLARGGSAAVILKLKAILLETPTSGLILLVAKPEGCLMNTTVTKTVTTTMQAPIIGIMGESTAVEVKQTTKTPGQGEWITITAVTNLRTTGITTTNITRTYTTTYNTTASFVKTIQPIIIATFTTRAATTVIVPMALTAENLEWWVSGPECFIVYKAINATSGSVLAEAWVKVKVQ